jgi:hypothetical protein
MSLPGDALGASFPADFLSPDDLGRPTRLTDFERGGIALNDGSQGLDVQDWRVRVVGDDVLISAFPYTSESVLITEANIRDISLAFDQNMRPTLAYMVGDAAKLYWYDAALPGQTTTTLAAGVFSPFLAMDDKRAFATSTASNDILLLYLRGSTLYYRQQRERYNTERTLRVFGGPGVSIKRAGMNRGLRFQIEVVGINAS